MKAVVFRRQRSELRVMTISFVGNSKMSFEDFIFHAEGMVDLFGTDTFNVFYLPSRSIKRPVFLSMVDGRVRYLTDFASKIDYCYARLAFDCWKKFLSKKEFVRFSKMLEGLPWKRV